MIDPDEYLDDPKMRKFGRLSREMQREWRDDDEQRRSAGHSNAATSGRETGSADGRDEEA